MMCAGWFLLQASCVALIRNVHRQMVAGTNCLCPETHLKPARPVSGRGENTRDLQGAQHCV